MNVLSLFDGMSCGQQAFQRLGLKIDNYFASEVDKYAISVTMANYPKTIQIGDVRYIDGNSLPKIDILIGGSPCQSFSFAGKRNGMTTKTNVEILTLEHYLKLKEENFDFEGQSYLFWEFIRLLNELKPKYFLLENVLMCEKWEKIINKAIGVNPIEINSSLVSAQNRKRLYWTNIGLKPTGLFDYLESFISQPKDKKIFLKDILEHNVDKKYYVSDKMYDWLKKHSEKKQTKIKILDSSSKSGRITSSAERKGNLSTNYICHNLQKRNENRPSIQKNKNAGGCGHLFRNDGKTYCLDTGNTLAIEIIGLTEVRTIEAKKIRKETGTNPKRAKELVERNDGKTGALLTSLTNDNLVCINENKNVYNIRKLTPLECMRLQTVSDDYIMPISDNQKYKCLGNGWTVDVIVHILSYINETKN